METTRRDLLKIAGLTGLGAGIFAYVPRGDAKDGDDDITSRLPAQYMPKPFTTQFREPPVLPKERTTEDPDGVLVDHYTVTERQSVVSILPGGLTTTVFGYDGMSPGPTLRARKGRRVHLRVRNALPARHPKRGYDMLTSTHLHGAPSLSQYDGYASDTTPPGYYKDYYYTGYEPARTLWYHDHAVHHTAENAYYGLAAQYHCHDDVEQELLPQDEYDVGLTVRDALFDRNGDLMYNDNDHVSLFGDVIPGGTVSPNATSSSSTSAATRPASASCCAT